MTIHSPKSYVRAFAPASVANVACGFDIFGFAFSALGDTVSLTREEHGGLCIDHIFGDDGRLSKDPSQNTASVALCAFCEHIKVAPNLRMTIEKGMPLGSGLGSSAASAVAALFAANELYGNPLPQQDLLAFAVQAEAMACGSAHADNAAPSLLGGFVLVRSCTPLDVLSLPIPPDLFAVVLHPDVEIRTEDARRLLGREVSLAKASQQWANAAALVAAFYTADYDLLSRCLVDHIAEPERGMLIPGFVEMKQAARDAGALGASISGSGPSVFALCLGKARAEAVAHAFASVCAQVGLGCQVYQAPLPGPGPKILETKA